MQSMTMAEDDVFKASRFYHDFMQAPIGFIDVGARFGSHSLVEPLHTHVSFLGFEPDEDECTRLNQDPALTNYWNQFKVLPHALSNAYEKRTLNITSLANNSSLLDPNPVFINRYNMQEKWTVIKRCPVDTIPLDDVMYALQLGFPHSGEIIKLDTQGTEYEILLGATRLLTDKTVCVVTEVEFCQLYQEQKLFSDVELLMRARGFSFYGFLTQHERSKKLLDKKTHLGRERLFYADAIFLKDPFSHAVSLTERQYNVLIFAAILTGFYDFALELAASKPAALSKDDMHCIRSLIQTRAFVSPTQTHEKLHALIKKMDVDKSHTNVYLGKFVDALNFPNFEDC